METWVELLHLQDREQATATMHRLIAGDLSQYQIEYWLRHKDGSYRLVRSCEVILRDAVGKPVHLGGWHINLAGQWEQQAHVASLCTNGCLALTRQPLVPVFLHHCVDALLTHLPIDWVGVWLREPDRHGFVPLACASRTPNAHGRQYDLPIGVQTVERIAASRQLCQEVLRGPLLHPQERAWAQRKGMNIFAGYPRCSHGKWQTPLEVRSATRAQLWKKHEGLACLVRWACSLEPFSELRWNSSSFRSYAGNYTMCRPP